MCCRGRKPLIQHDVAISDNNNNSLSQDYTQQDDHNSPSLLTRGFKPFKHQPLTTTVFLKIKTLKRKTPTTSEKSLSRKHLTHPENLYKLVLYTYHA